MPLLIVIHGIVVVVFSVYAAYFVWLALLPAISRPEPRHDVPADLTNSAPPLVTIQLPIYNEKHVATRSISATCALDYPLERLQIQVLDDSTDETSEIVGRCVEDYRNRGLNIEHLRRLSRDGYKAGALANGLQSAIGEYVAIFDADFVPDSQWLRHVMAKFDARGAERLGVVQTRWRHANGNESAFTLAQAVILDDYAEQQDVRDKYGFMPVFQGSAGIWRRACIDAAGGWSANTLAEDVDLSYRAYVNGWTMEYDPTILVAADIPTQILSYKRQQYRWAKGAMQATRLVTVRLLRAPLPLRKKTEALLYLTSNVIQFLLVSILVLKVPLLIWPSSVVVYFDMVLSVWIAGLVVPGIVAWIAGTRPAPFDAILQCGIALTGTCGALSGLFGPLGGEFQRTPKGALQEHDVTVPTVDATMLGELVLFVLALVCAYLAIGRAQWFALPILFYQVTGLGWMNVLQFREMSGAFKRKSSTLPK